MSETIDPVVWKETGGQKLVWLRKEGPVDVTNRVRLWCPDEGWVDMVDFAKTKDGFLWVDRISGDFVRMTYEQVEERGIPKW